MGGGAAILKQVTATLAALAAPAAEAARRTGPERNPVDYPGIKVNFFISRGEPDMISAEAVKRRNNGFHLQHLNL